MAMDLDQQIYTIIDNMGFHIANNPGTSGELKSILGTLAALINIASARQGFFKLINKQEEMSGVIKKVLDDNNEKREPLSEAVQYLADTQRPFSSSDYQEPLLKFLLFTDAGGSVFDTIEEFAVLIKDQLNVNDIERTKTGAMRCLTNIRFAANALRYYGFMRVDPEHDYKKWDLTMAGLLVADDIIEQSGGLDFTVHRREPFPYCGKYPLQPALRSSMHRFCKPKAVRDRISIIAKENFEGFKEIGNIVAAFCERYSNFIEKENYSKEEFTMIRNASNELFAKLKENIDWKKLKKGVRLRVQILPEFKDRFPQKNVLIKCLQCPACRYVFFRFCEIESDSTTGCGGRKTTYCPKCKKTLDVPNNPLNDAY